MKKSKIQIENKRICHKHDTLADDILDDRQGMRSLARGFLIAWANAEPFLPDPPPSPRSRTKRAPWLR